MARISENGVKKICEICERYTNEKTPLMMILSDIQNEYGYIPLEVQQIVSQKTGISVAEIYGVVTFYSFFSLEPKASMSLVAAWVLPAMLRALSRSLTSSLRSWVSRLVRPLLTECSPSMPSVASVPAVSLPQSASTARSIPRLLFPRLPRLWKNTVLWEVPSNEVYC